LTPANTTTATATDTVTAVPRQPRPSADWGKNFDRTFTSPDCPVRDNHWKFDALLDLAAKYDPDKVLQPPLMTKVISRTPFGYFPRCALAKQCYCKEDAHCGEGHACVPSAAFPEYKVCRPADLKASLG
jgi:hypothetical protein